MAKLSSKYLELLVRFPLRRIRSEADLDKATAVMRDLAGRAQLMKPEVDYLEVLADLIEAYEKVHHPIGAPSPHEMLAGLMEANGINQVELSKATGIPVSTISELLAQKREFNLAHIRKFAANFGVGTSAFIQEEKSALVG
jgi:HTH-type transcriptional regulator / antitoxin HigA